MLMPGVVRPVPSEPPAAPLFLEQLEQPDESSANVKRTMYNEVVPRFFRVLSLVLVTIVLVCSTGVARANGRFPAAQAIVTVPGSDGLTVFLRATFGVLVSRDGGKSWRWICERALGYDGVWDPPVAVTRDGRLWIGLERGLSSTLDGCSVEPATELAGETIRDLTTDVRGDTIWAVTGAPDRRGAVWRRSGASKWERLGLLPEGFYPSTLEVAASRPARIYVSGQPIGTIRGWLLHSDDGGKTFIGGKNDLEAEGPFFIADVDPKDPDRVLVRHLHTTGSDVLLTTDAGKTFKSVLTMKSGMYGFAKSADGSTYWAGSGLPEHGIFQSKDRGAHFERVSNRGVLCLHAAPNGRLLVCENPLTPGTPVVAVSTDDGKTLGALATFSDVQGPMSCGDAGPNVCAEVWPATHALLTPRVDAGAPPPSAAAPPPRKSACGCRIVGALASGPDHLWLTTGLLPLVMWGRARRRRGSRFSQSGPSRTSDRHRDA
jgi:photosystem II stability/assembly factor-like uncharacterized protein